MIIQRTYGALISWAVLMAAAPVMVEEAPVSTPIGAPGAITQINGLQLPPPPQAFDGRIAEQASESTP